MNKNKIVISTVILGLFAVFVWALAVDTSVSNVNLVAPVAGQNWSGSVLINVSAAYLAAADGSAGIGNITNVTVTINNATSLTGAQNTVVAYVLLDTDRSRNRSLSNVTNTQYINMGANGLLDTASGQTAIADGRYNLTLSAMNASDRVALANNTPLKIAGVDTPATGAQLIIIDNTRPLVRGVNSTNSSFYNFTTGNNVTLLITATNNTGLGNLFGTGIHQVTVQINNLTNGTSLPFNLTAYGYNSDDKQELWNISFNQSNYTKNDGNYSFTVYVNETAGTENSSVTGWFVIDTTAPPVVQRYVAEQANLSRSSLLFQANDSLTATLSCDLYVNSIRNVTNLNVTNGTTYNYTRSGGMADGNYNWSVQCNDSVKLQNISAVGNFTIDGTAPSVVQLYVAEHANLTTSRLLFQVNDSFTGTLSCDLYVNSVKNATSLNVTNSSTYNYTRSGGMADGDYNWSVQCNDTASSQNISTTRNFTIDTAAPTISLAASTTTTSSLVVTVTTTSDALSCTTSRPAATVTNGPGASQTITEVGLSAGTSYTYDVTCTDTAGNTASGSITTSTSTSTSSGSGSGSGGSGGGIASGKAGQIEKKTWASILAGEKASITTSNGVLGVTSIDFVVEKTTYGATMQVKKVDALPSSVKAFSEKKYKTLDISETNVEKALSGNAIINFKVEKKWLADNKLASNAVGMFHYKDNAWVGLKTTVGQDDGTYVHYTAETPGFSYFIIGEKSGVAVPVAEKKAAPSAAPTSVTEPIEAVAEEVTVEEPTGGSAVVWVIVGLVLVGLLAWVVMALRRRR